MVYVSQATEKLECEATCVVCGKDAVRECSNAVRWEVRAFFNRVAGHGASVSCVRTSDAFVGFSSTLPCQIRDV